MTIKYVMPKDAAAVESLIGKAVKSVQKARVDVQIAAVAILIHAEKHGDWTKANDLVLGLGNTVNGKALVEWFVRFGGLVVGEEEGMFIGWTSAEFIKEKFQESKAVMWWDLKVASPFKGFDLDAALNKVLSDYNKHQKNMEKLSEEDKAKVKTTVNDATIKAVLSICNFEGIFTEG